MFELSSSTGYHNTSNNFMLNTGIPNFHLNQLNDFFHARLNDSSQGSETNFFGRVTIDSGNTNNFISFTFAHQSASMFHFENLCVSWNYFTTVTYVFRDYIATEWNYSGMADKSIIENCHIGGSPADIHQNHSGFFFFIV